MEDKIIELYTQGLSDSEIGKEIGWLRRRVCSVRNKLNLTTNSFIYNKLDIEDIKELIKFNSLTKIAKLKNCSIDTISRFCKNNDIKYLYNNGNNSKNLFNPILSDRQKSILVGTMMGDSWMQKKKSTPLLSCTHSLKQKEYCYWKHEEFKSINSIYTENIRNIPDKRNGIRYETTTFRVNCNINFHEFYDIFYKNKVKYINPEIFKYYTDLSLAVHYMDDGCKHSGTYSISTNSFSIEDLNIFRQFLLDKWGLYTSLHKSHVVYILKKSKEKFESLINPYILPSLKYKIYCPL